MHTLNDGGEMGAMMRAHDWSAHPLGPVEHWPQALKTATSILLSSKFPMFVAWGPELSFLYNDSYAEILGDKHPALGKPFQEIWAEIWPDILPIIDRALAGEATFWENLPLTMNRHGFDEQTWFTFSYSPLHDEGGAVRGMFCACTETTAAVRAEKRREQEMDRLRNLLHEAPSFMAVVGRDELFYLANRAYLASIGEEDVVGRSFKDVFPPDQYPGSADRIEEVMRTGKSYSAEGVPVELKGRRGAPDKELVLDFLVQPIVERDQVIAVFVAGNDVTARHHAEARLRESEQRFRLIANSAPVPVWVTRLDRTRDFVNEAYVEFVGLPEEEPSGSTGAPSSTPTTTTGSSPSPSRARRASSPSHWRRATAAATGRGAGSARPRSRAGARTGNWTASSASPTTSLRPKRPRRRCAT